MRHFPLFLSLLAASTLPLGCAGSGGGGASGDDDDDAATSFPSPGTVDVPASTGPQTTLPDLTVDVELLQSSQEIRLVDPAEHPNEVAEGCLVDEGIRTVLVFSVGVANIGPVDLFVGDPWSYPDEDQDGIPDDFEWSPAHGHLHFPGFAEYRIRNASGDVAVGRKQAFCLMDIDDYSPDGVDPDGGGYECGYQGISAGWEDIYDRNLPCQWVDVTNVPDGEYQLSVTVNAEHAFAESGPGPNTVTVPLTLPLPE